MIHDFRQYDEGRVIEADVCVIGAGAAGITIATQLAAAGARICLVESGGTTLEPATQQLYAARAVGLPRRPHTATRLRFLGGTTNHWTGMCAPLDADDFEAKTWIPFSGWPITRAELDPYYERAAAICRLKHQVFDRRIRMLVGRTAPEMSPTRLLEFYLHYSPAVRFGVAYREELAGSERALVLLHANITNVEPTLSGTHIEHVDVRSLEGKAGRVRARVFVLSCGGIENARVLLLSDGVTKTGLGNQHGLVGRFLMDHPFGKCADIVQSGHVPMHELYTDFAEDGGRYRPGFALSPEVRRENRVLNCGAHLWNSYETESPGAGAARAILADLAGGRRPQRLKDSVEEVIADLDHLMTDIARRVAGGEGAGEDRPRMNLICALEQAPNPDSRVRLDTEKDAMGLRRAAVDWRLTELDRRTLITTAETMGYELGRLNVGRLRMPDWLLETGPGWESQLSDYNHHMGTTRMSSDPAHGVVDAQCRVHGIDNLYVAGSSVFATAGHVNPTLTIVALASRLADYLERRSVA